MTEEDLTYYENYKESLTKDSLDEAYVDIYNTSPKTLQESEEDVTSYLPNKNSNDATNKPVCGKEFLK